MYSLLQFGSSDVYLLLPNLGMLRRWDDSQKYLSDNPYLVCEETANYLVIMCIDLEVEEVRIFLFLYLSALLLLNCVLLSIQ